jgi:hypothetical protein
MSVGPWDTTRTVMNIPYSIEDDDTIKKSRWGDIFLTRPERPWAHPDSHAMGNGSFCRVKRPGRDVHHSPNLEPRLKKE